nr:EAL domain-containing protein [Rubrobacter marinus]
MHPNLVGVVGGSSKRPASRQRASCWRSGRASCTRTALRRRHPRGPQEARRQARRRRLRRRLLLHRRAQALPLDILKIDSSFVKSFHEREEDCRIVSAVIGLAHALELTAVAQGVDTPASLCSSGRWAATWRRAPTSQNPSPAPLPPPSSSRTFTISRG